MLALALAHAVAAALAPALVRRLARRAFLVLALVPLVTFGWVLAQTGAVRDGDPVVQTTSWVPGLGLDLSFSLGPLQWVLALVVAGVGVLVLVYCARYFGDGDRLEGFATNLVAFMGAMLGLVCCDNLLLLYVFWELTTVFSFLLIGFDPASRTSRRAAIQALVVTSVGGLTMLVGMLVLGQQAGTLSISGLLADPPSGTATTVGVLLVLVGALSKSAQVPFQFWLPGAMAAPTPVSAYLHAASMVKAGVYLVALLAPAFAATPGWRPVLLVLGGLTMLYGGWRALAQTDLKLLLAYGTVSQLGFLMTVLGTGSRTAALAGVAMVLAHALFKAALFLVVGIVDHETGTRDLRKLSGLGRRWPLLAVLGGLAAASMAGLPPLLGFVGKETVWAGALELADGGLSGVAPVAGWGVVLVLLVGSALTAGYTARWWWGAFASKAGVEPGSRDARDRAPRPPAPGTPGLPLGLVGPVAVLAGLGLVLGLAGGALDPVLAVYADTLPSAGYVEHLALWHGWELPLLLSALTIAGGAALFLGRDAVARFQAGHAFPVTAERGYRKAMRGLDRTAVEVTGVVQRGSLTAYLVVTFAVVVLLPGAAAAAGLLGLDGGVPLSVHVWDTPAQAVVGVVMVAAALASVRARRRLRAVVLAGVTGYGAALLFVLHGGPDIALTQAIVETVSLVVFVLALRRLPDYFSLRAPRPSQAVRVVLAAAVGLTVAGFLLLASGSRSLPPISADFARQAYEFGYGRNVVNVTLVDIRAWDTFGEISVLVAAATGVASLIVVRSRSTTIRRAREVAPDTEGIPAPSETSRVRNTWLSGARTQALANRSVVLEVAARVTFHPVLVFSLYLLLAGHNLPGGGFAGGMVAGLALMVRYLAAGRAELDEAAPVDAGVLIGLGLLTAALAGLGPVLAGGSVLQTADVYLDLPLLGELHLVSSVGFDIGVYLVVVGLVLDLLRTFGSQVDRHVVAEQREREEAA